MIYYDTSALIKLYYPEPDSQTLSKWVATKDQPIPFTSFHELELNNALSLKVFRGELSDDACGSLMRLCNTDLSQGLLTRIQIGWQEVLRKATRLSATHTPSIGCRSLDILHVSIAIVTDHETFVTFDDRQRALAEASGLFCPQLESL